MSFWCLIDQLNEVRKTSLARLICDNTKSIEKIQPLALEKHDDQFNPKLFCNSGLEIPTVDLSQWRQ